MPADALREVLMDQPAVERALDQMALELQAIASGGELVLIGIQRRGVQLADLLVPRLGGAGAEGVPTGTLDITLYRDDLMAVGPRPVVGETRLPDGGVDGRTLVIVDDVLYTGRTARAALDEIADFGRPRRVLLCVLVDRGGRELPIHADVVGRAVAVADEDRVVVSVPELDGRLQVEVVRGGAADEP